MQDQLLYYQVFVLCFFHKDFSSVSIIAVQSGHSTILRYISCQLIQKANELRTVFKVFFASESFINEVKPVDQIKTQVYSPNYEL